MRVFYARHRPLRLCVYVDYVQHLIRRIPRVRSLGARIAAHANANANALHYHIAPHRTVSAGPVLCSPYSRHSYVQTSKWHTISMEIMRLGFMRGDRYLKQQKKSSRRRSSPHDTAHHRVAGVAALKITQHVKASERRACVVVRHACSPASEH